MTDPSQEAPEAMPPPSGIWVHVCGRTHVGQVREHNEDSYLVADLSSGAGSFPEDQAQQLGSHGAVFAVCDGMGGAAAGEVASNLAVQIIQRRLVEPSPPAERSELASRLIGSIQDAGVRIFADARSDRSHRGMGTTSTVAALLDEELFLAQVGDSRAYILRDGLLVQVTRDQSLVNQLIESGQLTEEEAETFEHNNIILQALGTAEAVQVDLTRVLLRRGDTLVLCSDGLSGMVRSEVMRSVLLEADSPKEACQQLVESANAAGGHDNVTAVVVRFSGTGLGERNADDPPVEYSPYSLPPQPGEPQSERPGEGDAALRSTAKEAPLSRSMLADLEHAAQRARAEESALPPMQGLPPKTVTWLVMAGLTLLLGTLFFLLR